MNISAIVGPIYSCILPRLEAHDIDQEIKECAINTIGVFFACLGYLLTHSLLLTITHSLTHLLSY